MNFLSEIDDRKEREEGRNKQTCELVPNKYFRERGRYRSGVSPTFSQRAVRLLSSGRTGSLNRDISKPSGNTHKIPEKFNCRRDRDFQILQKDAAESENRLIHKNVNRFIAYF